MAILRRSSSASALILGLVGVLGMSVAVPGALPVPSASALARSSREVPVAVPLFVSTGRSFSTAVAATAYCASGGWCSTPKQLEALYDMDRLFSKGETGKGVTIAIVDAFGSPTIAHDLSHFDKVMKIPDPPKLTIIQPAGKVPRFNPNRGDVVEWATETTLDVECAHSMAPGANILLVETPVDETEGTAGFPQIEKAVRYVVDHHLAKVISQSFGATEQTFPDKSALLSLRGAYIDAQSRNVTVIAASGDQGASDVKAVTAQGYVYFTRRAVDWPASDPLVTAVGGTYVDRVKGVRARPDSVWNTTSAGGVPAASGGGESVDFSRPSWQDGVASLVGGRRGLPDVALEASPEDGALIYSSIPGEQSGFYSVGGTSEAAPLFAGIVAVADQVAGTSLGLLNPELYALGSSKASGLVDVKSGNNSVAFTQDGRRYSVTGWDARAGFDLASGWGTIDGYKLVTELAAAYEHERERERGTAPSPRR